MPLKRTKHKDLSQLTRLAKELSEQEVATGWFESAKYGDGTPVAYVASIQEYGSGPIPPRPTQRPTVATQSQKWGKIYGQTIKTANSGGQVLEVMGAVIAGDMREAISELTSPPLAESTIKSRKRKGNSSTKPLVDQRIMMNTLTHLVRGKTS